MNKAHSDSPAPHPATFPWLVIIMLTLQPAIASADSAFGIGLDLLHFDYREFDRDDNQINRERGLLPGILLQTRTRIGALRTEFEASLHGGDVDYDGQTQAGSGFQTDTRTRLISLSGRIGSHLKILPGDWYGFIHAARRQWNRDIQGRDDVQGLSETYRWTEAGAALRYIWPRATPGDWDHSIEFTAFAVVDGTVHVELSNLDDRGWDDVTLALGDDRGLRLRYRAIRTIGTNRALQIEPYITVWSFGRSSTRTIRADGQRTGARIAEPRSDSRQFGVFVSLTF